MQKEWFVELLINEKVVGPLLSYEKNTEVSNRNRAAEMIKNRGEKMIREGKKIWGIFSS